MARSRKKKVIDALCREFILDEKFVRGLVEDEMVVRGWPDGTGDYPHDALHTHVRSRLISTGYKPFPISTMPEWVSYVVRRVKYRATNNKYVDIVRAFEEVRANQGIELGRVISSSMADTLADDVLQGLGYPRIGTLEMLTEKAKSIASVVGEFTGSRIKGARDLVTQLYREKRWGDKLPTIDPALLFKLIPRRKGGERPKEEKPLRPDSGINYQLLWEKLEKMLENHKYLRSVAGNAKDDLYSPEALVEIMDTLWQEAKAKAEEAEEFDKVEGLAKRMADGYTIHSIIPNSRDDQCTVRFTDNYACLVNFPSRKVHDIIANYILDWLTTHTRGSDGTFPTNDGR